MTSLRATANGTISFGLVAIPVKFYLACSPEAVAFNQFTPDGHRIKQKLVDEVTGQEVDRETLSKGYEYAKGQFVVFTADEIKALETAGDKTVEIEACVPLSEIDLFQVEKTYYLGPDKGGDKAYGLLVDTLEAAGKGAVAQWSTRGREHLVLIRSYRGGLLLHTLFYTDEVRDQSLVTGAVAKLVMGERERTLAARLVDQMSGSVDLASYRDRYRERVLAAVQAKVDGKEVVIPTMPAAPQIIDLFEALKLSLGGVKEAPQAYAPKAKVPAARKGKRTAA